MNLALRLSITILFLLGAGTALRAHQDAPPSSQPATDQAPRLPTVQLERISDCVKFAVEADLLTARTSLGQPGAEVRIVTPGTTGVIGLSLLDMADGEPGRDFRVHWTDRAKDGSAEVITQISATAGHLLIARGAESDSRVSSTQYIQSPRLIIDPNSDEPPVKLYVQITNQTSGAAEVDLKLSGPSFTELRRKYPREVNQYLRPILRDFGQEQAIFGADVRAQWQVLSSDVPPDDATVARVSAVVSKFNSESYLDRERAAEELQKLGQPAAAALVRMDRSKFSAEQNSGVDTFLAPYLPLSGSDVQRLGSSVDFLLDCVYSDDAALRKLAIARLEKLAGRSLNLESTGSAEARAAAIERLRVQLSTAASSAPTTQP